MLGTLWNVCFSFEDGVIVHPFSALESCVSRTPSMPAPIFY